MDDYIKRKSVYDALCKICNERGACEYTGQESCHKVFSQIPAVDAVEVVRCKDCKYLEISGCYGECEKAHLGIVQPDDYCSHGVRRFKDDG